MWKTGVALAAAVLIAGCSSPNSPSQPSPASNASSAPRVAADARAAAREVVLRFGRQMQKISVLAPADAVRPELSKVYGTLLSPELLATWRAHPEQVIGREGSSPWPQKIEIDSIDCAGPDTCRVTGKVDYITSNEVEHGGVFMRRGIKLALAHDDHGWRITSVHLAPAEH